MGADLLCGGLDGLLGERDDALDIDAAPLAEVGGEAQHPRASKGQTKNRQFMLSFFSCISR